VTVARVFENDPARPFRPISRLRFWAVSGPLAWTRAYPSKPGRGTQIRETATDAGF